MVKKNFLKSSLIVLAVLAVALIPTASVNAAIDNRDVPTLAYSAHVQGLGWMGRKSAGTDVNDANTIAGTEGQSKRVEALRVSFDAPTGVTLKYNAHIQGKGWTGWTEITEDNQLIGTEGESKRLEAIKFAVTGLEGFQIKYRAHVQTYGWMDWVTADESESLAKIVGTEGESKRIESLQILILNDTQSTEFDLKQQAIKELKAFANPAEFTMNAKLLAEALEDQIANIESASGKSAINKALNDAKAAIEDTDGVGSTDSTGVLNDRQVRAAIKKLGEDLDDTLTTTDQLDQALTAGELKGVKLLEVASIKEAVEDAKAELYNKEEYVSTDFTKTSGKYFKEAYNTVKRAVLDYAVESLETLYNAEADKAHDNKILSIGKYKDAKKKSTNSLADFDKLDTITDADLDAMTGTLFKTFFNTKLVRDITIQGLRDAYKNKLDMTGAAANCDDDVKKYAEAPIVYYQKLQQADLLESGITKYIDISWVKEAIQDGLNDIDTAMNAPQLDTIFENTKSNALAGLVRFVTKLRNDLSGLNGTGKVLSDDAITAINKVLASKDLTGTDLVTGCTAMINSLGLDA